MPECPISRNISRKGEISQYQGESGDCEQGFKATVDEERAEQPQTVVSEVFEGQLEDVSPADTAEIDLFGRAVGSTAQHQELEATALYLSEGFEHLLWQIYGEPRTKTQHSRSHVQVSYCLLSICYKTCCCQQKLIPAVCFFHF